MAGPQAQDIKFTLISSFLSFTFARGSGSIILYCLATRHLVCVLPRAIQTKGPANKPMSRNIPLLIDQNVTILVSFRGTETLVLEKEIP